MIKQGYSKPKLHESEGDVYREWYVDFRFTCPTCVTRSRYQYRMGINFLTTATERRKEGGDVIRLLDDCLRSGWNPHHEKVDDYLRRAVKGDLPTPGDMPFNQALDYALESKKANLAPKTYAGFTTCKEYAKAASIKLGYYDMPVKEIRRAHIKELMNQIVRERQAEYDVSKKWAGRKVTGNFYNKYKGYLGCILAELVECEAMEYNPCDKIKAKPKIKTNIHRHATEKERQIIKSTLQLKCPQFYYFLDIEYSTGIRPKEIFYIRICDIDWLNQTFNISPYDGASKTREARRVPIPDVLMKHLKAMHLERFPPTHYIFSNAFRPGEERKSRDYATKLWKELIRDGAKLDVSLYSFKGLGGEDKRKAGVSLNAVASQYGHSSIRTTMIYTHGEQERMNQELREKTPGL